MIGQQVYMDRPSLALSAEDKTTSARYNKLLWHTMGPCTVMDVKSHVMTIDEDGKPSTMFIDRAIPVSTDSPATTRTTPRPDQPAQTTLSQNIDADKEPPEYVADEVMDHRHTSDDHVYRVHWYRCTPEENTWEPASHLPRHFITRY